MQKLPKDYSKALLYTITYRNPEIKDLYVGSTTDLIQRKKSHESTCTNQFGKKYNILLYAFIREHGGFDAWKITEIEKFPCTTKHELLVRERFHIERLGATLNGVIPTRTLSEWREANKDYLAERAKQYYAANKDAILIYHYQYYQINKEAIAEKGKQHYQSNKEIIKDRAKRYCAANKEAVAARQKQYGKDNIERRRAYKAANRDKIREQQIKWRNNNPDKISVYKARRHALSNTSEATVESVVLNSDGQERTCMPLFIVEIIADYYGLPPFFWRYR